MHQNLMIVTSFFLSRIFLFQRTVGNLSVSLQPTQEH